MPRGRRRQSATAGARLRPRNPPNTVLLDGPTSYKLDARPCHGMHIDARVAAQVPQRRGGRRHAVVHNLHQPVHAVRRLPVSLAVHILASCIFAQGRRPHIMPCLSRGPLNSRAMDMAFERSLPARPVAPSIPEMALQQSRAVRVGK